MIGPQEPRPAATRARPTVAALCQCPRRKANAPHRSWLLHRYPPVIGEYVPAEGPTHHTKIGRPVGCPRACHFDRLERPGRQSASRGRPAGLCNRRKNFHRINPTPPSGEPRYTPPAMSPKLVPVKVLAPPGGVHRGLFSQFVTIGRGSCITVNRRTLRRSEHFSITRKVGSHAPRRRSFGRRYSSSRPERRRSCCTSPRLPWRPCCP